jgi:N-acetylglucosaminyl-diphospho-decaprenol L-rhamnosyltransferase
MATEPSVSVVVVSYNTRDLLRACLASVAASTLSPHEVFVVDNASSDGSADMVVAEFPGVTLIPLSRNRGFAGANNVAIRRCTGDRILLLNPDATLAPDALATLSDALDRWPKAASVGPRVLNPDGTLQSCGYRFPTLLREIRQSKRVNQAITLVLGPDEPLPAPVTEVEVDWSDGACMLLRRAAVDDIGGLDEQFFLFNEEVDWCYNARRAGWTVLVAPQATVWHHRGQSSQATGTGSRSTALLVETRLRYYRKNHSLATAWAAAAVLSAGFVKQRRHDPAALAKLEGVSAWRRNMLAVRPAGLRRSRRAG